MTNYTVKDHLLVPEKSPAPFIPPCPNVGGPLAVGTPDVPFIVIHYTAGPSLKGAVSGFMDPRRKASAHLVIGEDRTVQQVVPFNKIAWHAGVSEWKERMPSEDNNLGNAFKTWTGLNHSSLGIELVNPGPLKLGKDGQWWTWYGEDVASGDVEVHPGLIDTHGNKLPDHWRAYNDDQLEVLVEVLLALKEAYPNLRQLLGHSDIAPGRKMDPGPAFPMDHVRAIFEGRNQS